MSEDLKVHIRELQRTTADKERLLKELEIARGIQQSFLPDFTPQMQKFDIAAMNLPARMVSGDFYDFIPIQKDKWGLVIADVSGKGVPAALFMALSRALIRASASITLSPADAVRHANNLILEDSKSSMFVTLFYAVLDAQTRVLKYSNAGHNPPFIMSGAAKDLVFLKAQAMPLGVMPDIKVFNEEIVLNRGDIVLLYTDGVTEAVNAETERFEMERLEDVVQKNRQLSAQEIIDKIEKRLTFFVGGQPQFDDITMIVIKAE